MTVLANRLNRGREGDLRDLGYIKIIDATTLRSVSVDDHHGASIGFSIDRFHYALHPDLISLWQP